MSLQNADAIITLGRVDEYGHLTIDAHERIRYTAELYARKLAPIIVAPARWWYKLTYTPPETEAGIIAARLIEHGVPSDAIVREEKSCDTFGAAYFLKTEYVMPRNWKNIIVVTSEDHLARTKYVFHKVFGDDVALQYTWGNRVLDETQLKTSLEREAKSLKLMESTWFGPIKPGNAMQLAEILVKHPGYNPKVDLTPAEIERRVQAQSTA